MPRRSTSSHVRRAPIHESVITAGDGCGPVRILVVSASRVFREAVAARLSERDAICVQAESASGALTIAAGDLFDAAILHHRSCAQGGPDPLTLAGELSRISPGLACVLLADEPSLDLAVSAMRAGVVDLAGSLITGEELLARVSAARDKTRALREADRRADRLKHVCRRLNASRHEVTTQLRSLCADLSQAYQELAAQMTQVSVAGEFAGLIRHELQIEGVLRSTLEFILAKTGHTNAAIFLPSGSCDWSLGAYVNYDCPKETVDVLLDHLASAVAPRLTTTDDVRRFNDDAELGAYLQQHGGEHPVWLENSTSVAFSCWSEGECLAVVLLFRDRATPFSVAALRTLQTVRDLLSKQLGRVIRMHYRHQPKDKWGMKGNSAHDDDADLAA